MVLDGRSWRGESIWVIGHAEGSFQASKNGPKSDGGNDAGGGDRYGSIAYCEGIMIILVQWSEEGRRLACSGPKWQRCEGWKNVENVGEILVKWEGQ